MGNEWLSHVLKYHRKFLRMFRSQIEGHIPQTLDLDNRITNYRSIDSGFAGYVDEKYAMLYKSIENSAIINEIAPFPDIVDTRIDSTFISHDTEDFANHSEALATIRIIESEDISFNILARMLCEQCKNYGRKRHCPPRKGVDDKQLRDLQKRYPTCIIIILQGDGLIGTEKRPDGVGLRWGMPLIGVDSALTVESRKILVEIADRLRKKSGVYIAMTGPCKICKGGCHLPPDKCPHPIAGGCAPESIGIDVQKLLVGLEIPFEMPVFSFVTKVGLIFTSLTGEDWEYGFH